MLAQKRLLIAFGIAAVLTVVVAACTIQDLTSLPTGPTVHMGSTNFVVNTITLTKGQSLTLINDASDEHILTNGTWDGAVQKPNREPGAPTVNLTFVGQSSQHIGPLTTAGTFHIYCTIHQGMQLAIPVQ
jgi:plastocyanin